MTKKQNHAIVKRLVRRRENRVALKDDSVSKDVPMGRACRRSYGSGVIKE